MGASRADLRAGEAYATTSYRLQECRYCEEEVKMMKTLVALPIGLFAAGGILLASPANAGCQGGRTPWGVGTTCDGPIAQDGTFQVRQRMGRQVTTVQGPTMHAAIRRPAANGQSSNALEVRVAGDTISYVVNGMVVHSGPKGSTTTDGVTGVRINHVLTVHVEGFAVGK